MTTIQVKMSSILLPEANIRVATPNRALFNSIRVEGMQIPLDVRRVDGGYYRIVDGVQRFFIMWELGAQEIAVSYPS